MIMYIFVFVFSVFFCVSFNAIPLGFVVLLLFKLRDNSSNFVYLGLSSSSSDLFSIQFLVA